MKPGRLAFVIQHSLPGSDDPALIFYFDVEEWQGEARPGDPDGVVVEVRFFPLPDAIAMVEQHLPWRREREPTVAYLRGEAAAGAFWVYWRCPGADDEFVVRT